MAMTVQFTDLKTGKVSSPSTTTPKDAKYVYKYAGKVATAFFLVELFKDGVLVASQQVGKE